METIQEETGWLPDLIYTFGAFESGLAMFADSTGRITRFSRASDDLAKAQRLEGRAILPGLVNAHSHAFQRAIRGRTEQPSAAKQDTFWTWRENMYDAANRLSPEALYYVSRMAFLEMLLSGITTVGEFHYLHHAPDGVPYENRNLLALEVIRAAEDLGLRIVLLRASYARAGWDQPADPRQARFLTPRVEDFLADTDALRSAVSGRARVGVAPHSIRAVPLEYLRDVADYACANNLPMHMHVAEQPGEVEACLAEHGLRPVELLHREGILDSRFTAVHAIHVTDEEIRYLASGWVCACPTTERNLGDGIVPADKMGGLCFGSDSNVQIDLLEDARSVEYHLRTQKLQRSLIQPKSLFTCATASGASSLGSPDGGLEVRRSADFFTVDLNDPSIAGADKEHLLDHIVFSLERTAIRDVAVAGKFLIRDGHHALEDEIIRDFDHCLPGIVQR